MRNAKAVAKTMLETNICTVVALTLLDEDTHDTIEYGTLWVEHDPCDTEYPESARYAGETDAEYVRNDVPFPDGDIRPTVEEFVEQVREGMEIAWRDYRRTIEPEA